MTIAAKNFMNFDSSLGQLRCQGEWSLANIVFLKKSFAEIRWPTTGNITIDGDAITKMDSAGAWLINKWLKALAAKGLVVHQQGFSDLYQQLLSLVEKHTAVAVPKVASLNWLARLGLYASTQLIELRDYLAFAGKLTMEALYLVRHPGRFRGTAFAAIIDKTGYQALPIIALLSFMVGVVIAYQMGVQLRSYGANIFIVDFLGLSVLREFGPLLTAIMVAGRTGSAFTAQLGTMKINQEIDALNTMGITPGELLLLPRIFGLFLVLPLLTMWADVFGVFGGMLMAKTSLSITLHDFLLRFQHQIPLKSLLIGLGKAPIFALIIASVGCFQGMRVQLNADSIGKQTTRSVVLSIFFIIVVDAIFSVLLSRMKL